MKHKTGNSFSRSGLWTWTGLIPYFIGLVVLWAIINITFKKDYKTGIIEADGKGYYAYLPAVFIYHDLNFGFFDQVEKGTYYNPNLYYEYRRSVNDKTIDKYYVGTAICLAPFFLMGHGISLITGFPADGYSYYYTMMVHLGALFYFVLALLGLRRLLRTFGISETIIAFTLVAIVFGTNLFYYVLTEFSMSHVYSFTAITWFGLMIRKYFTDPKNKYLVYSALLLGIIVLIRPVNVLILFAIPFLATNPDRLSAGFKHIFTKKWILLLSLFSFIALVSVQLLIYKISTGRFIVYSYKEEGFHFLKPQIWNFLFSYRKGMFVYTPLLLLSLGGLFYLFPKSRFQFYSLSGFLIILVYVFSSWHMWFYGGSFSQRVMIDFYAFFTLILAMAVQEINNSRLKILFMSSVVLLVLVCQIQTYQYRRMQIHWSDMNKEKYWEVFMRIDKL